MKALKLFSIAIIVMAITLGSCTGDDGETGPQGPQGVAGVDGMDGQDGHDGANGNANVQAFSVDVSDWAGGKILPFNIPDNIDKTKYAFLFYLESLNGEYVFPVPGASLDGSFNTTLFYSQTTEGEFGDAQISFFSSIDGTAFNMPPNVFGRVIIIAAEIGTASKNGFTDVLSELKASGVDLSDYHAVAAYFRLEI
ncbi:hypothetical protein [Flagellimonas beolgyonensis]|uniref:hypothetical protein n=1 Tax=Flagellimonas beolgyonensis TaxID=864064 RepID=UPI003D65F19F